MPIDFAPPQPNAQPFNIAPVQYTDPLQTLAQMGQLRTQALQQQNAQMQLNQAQLAYKSNQAMMQAFAQGNGDWPTTQKLLDSSADILPSDRMAVEQHRVQLQQSYANLTKDEQAIHEWNSQKYRANLDGVTDQDSLDQANLKSAREGVSFSDPNAAGGSTTGVPQLTKFTDVPHVKAYANSLVLPPQISKEALETAQAGEATAKGAESTAQARKLDRDRAISEVQAAVDPATGVPPPDTYTAIQKRYPNVSLPATPTPANMAQLVTSVVPAAEQPKTRMDQMKADLMAQAQLGSQNGIHPIDSILPASVDPQLNASYKSAYDLAMKTGGPDKADAVAQAAAAHVANHYQLQASQISTPTPQDIDQIARQMLTGDMSPDDLKDLRTRNINVALAAYRRAGEIAKVEGNPLFPGRPFSPADLGTALNTRAQTEQKFATGPEAQMVRSFDNLMQHTALLDQARKALYQSDFPTIRRIANTLGVAAGKDAATTYDTIANFVSDESAKSFLPGGGGEAERAKTASNFSRNLGDKQISSNIRALMDLADAQRKGLEDQYQRGTFGKGLQTGKIFSPEALSARDQLMGKTPGGGTPTGTKDIVQRDGKFWMYKGTGDRNDPKNYAEEPSIKLVKTYRQSDVDNAVKAYPGMTPAQIEDQFKAKGWKKQ